MRLESEVRRALNECRKALREADIRESLIVYVGLFSALYILEWVLEEKEPVIDGFLFSCKELERICEENDILQNLFYGVKEGE